MILQLTVAFLVAVAGSASADGIECDSRTIPHQGDSVVCVCTEDYCDYPGTISNPAQGQFTAITTSKAGLRFYVETGDIASTAKNTSALVHVNHGYEYQSMVGFGGAFTDSTGLNIRKLSETAQDKLIRSYFSPEGIAYSVGRIPIAGSDFSIRPYSYDDVEGDVELNHFNLTEEDYSYKIPYIKRAMEVAEEEILTFGSPWAPPAWMKENGMVNGSGGLLYEMRQPYSDYFVKFVQAYENEGVPLWGLTTQNEPLTGFEDWMWNTCAWTPEDMRDWIKTNLGPTLEAAGMRRLKLMVLDHNRDALPQYPARMLEDPESSKYIDGVALHWYADSWTGANVMDETHGLFPDKFIMYTETCEGWMSDPDHRVILGDWSRAQNYAYNILDDVNHWSVGWVDWNMALDMQGGPNWAYNYVDAPIIINEETGEFYKQPMFYALGHFSKFVQRDAKRIWSKEYGTTNLRVAAFHNPDGTTALVLLNMSESVEPVSVDLGGDVGFINMEMDAKAIMTFLYNTPAAAV